MFLVSSCSCICPIQWSQVLSREWRCSWSSADRHAPTTSEWSTILFPTEVRLILETWKLSFRIKHLEQFHLEIIWLNPTIDMSVLVQVMAWCRQATGLYLSQCWPKYLAPYGVTMWQWVEIKSKWPCGISLLMATGDKPWFYYHIICWGCKKFSRKICFS